VPLEHEMKYAASAEMPAHGQPRLSGADDERVDFFNPHVGDLWNP
jgi:hypothetical protein